MAAGGRGQEGGMTAGGGGRGEPACGKVLGREDAVSAPPDPPRRSSSLSSPGNGPTGRGPDAARRIVRRILKKRTWVRHQAQTTPFLPAPPASHRAIQRSSTAAQSMLVPKKATYGDNEIVSGSSGTNRTSRSKRNAVNFEQMLAFAAAVQAALAVREARRNGSTTAAHAAGARGTPEPAVPHG
eukprot:gene15339-biopygen6664